MTDFQPLNSAEEVLAVIRAHGHVFYAHRDADGWATLVTDREQPIQNLLDKGYTFRTPKDAPTPEAERPALVGGEGGMLPDALVPHAKEWYRLCERRFAVEKITISGELAEAIVEAMGRPRVVLTAAQDGDAVRDALQLCHDALTLFADDAFGTPPWKDLTSALTAAQNALYPNLDAKGVRPMTDGERAFLGRALATGQAHITGATPNAIRGDKGAEDPLGECRFPARADIRDGGKA